MLFTRPALRAIVLSAAFALAACGRYDNSALDVAVLGGKDDAFAQGPSAAAQLTRAATAEGLVAFDDAGRVIPALADRWIVTDDGQSYIFRLRDGNWANGDPITAETARRAFNAALKTLGDAPLARDLGGIDEVRAMAGRVIEIRLRRPMPYLLQLLAQPQLGLYHKGKGTGPMTMRRVGDLAVLSPIEPSQLGLPAIDHWRERTRTIQLRALPGEAAVQAFNDGTVDLVLGGRIQDFLLTRSVGILRGTIQLDPVAGLFGLQIANENGFLSTAPNREALAMAIDRDGLMAPFRVGGWVGTTRIVTPGLEGELGTLEERWAGQTLEQRRAVAAQRVRAFQGTGGPVTLTVLLPEGAGSQVLFERLASDLATIGVRLQRTDRSAQADLVLIDDVATYPRASWFLNRLSCRERRGACAPQADALMAEADSAASPDERATLLAQAQAQLTDANVFIPFGAPIRWSLVRGSVNGFTPNAGNWHPLMPLSWLPR